MSYSSILRDLKRRINLDELGVTIQGIRETRSKDLLVELKCLKEGRGRLNPAFQEAIGVPFGHMPADCRGPDRSRSCWKCGEEEHTAGTCTRVYGIISAPLERRSPGSITSRVQCVVRLSVRQPQKGNLVEAAIKDQAVKLRGCRSSAYCACKQGLEV